MKNCSNKVFTSSNVSPYFADLAVKNDNAKTKLMVRIKISLFTLKNLFKAFVCKISFILKYNFNRFELFIRKNIPTINPEY